MSDLNISKKLLELRVEKGITQGEVASALSVSNKTISKWENGTSAPDLSSLADLARYYNVSIDTLFGLQDDKRNTRQTIADEFRGLNRRETILKVFEIVENMFPITFAAAGAENDNICSDLDTIPSQNGKMPRSQISIRELFNFMVCSDDVNFAVIQLCNKSNFAWLLDESKQNSIIKLLQFLADADVMKILFFIHSTACSESFTAAYISNNTGVPIDKTNEVLEICTEIDVCNKVTAHLKGGEIAVFESFGDGLILSLLSIAYERMCGQNNYNYCYNGKCKMIGGEKK